MRDALFDFELMGSLVMKRGRRLWRHGGKSLGYLGACRAEGFHE